MAFKNAILSSILIHALVLNPLYNNVNPKRHAEEKKHLVVDYVIIKETKDLEPASQIMKTIVAETPKVELRSDIKPKPSPIDDVAKRQVQIKASKDYIGYYQLIREKVRARLKENYVDYSTEGDVHLIFVLDSGGRLLEYAIEHAKSTGDKKLLDIAVISLRQAAPFPPFPKGLATPQMSFDLTISFKRR